jgi:GT2 family glycosyltransferase/glycosyltransferase involved in cell wall biosynthesis
VTPRQRLRAAVEKYAPPGTLARDAARAAWLTAREAQHARNRAEKHWRLPQLAEVHEPSYLMWHRRHDVTESQLTAQARVSGTTKHPISTLVLVLADGSSDRAEASVRSVEAQSWGHVTVRTVPAGDVEAVQAAVADAGQDFVLFLAAGDVLQPDCLYHVALAAHRDPLVDLVYWDDDRLGPAGVRREPRFRPSWSPDLLSGADYLGRAFAIRSSRFTKAGGLRPGLGDAATWDLLLRADLTDKQVFRVSRVLSSVRERPAAPAAAAVRVVQDHLDRKGLAAKATAEGQGVRTTWDATQLPKVTIVIPTRHNRMMLSTCLPSLARTDYAPGFDVVIIDNGGQSEANDAWYAESTAGLDLRVIWWTEPFNYSQVNNVAARTSDSEVIVFLNDDTEVLDKSWLTEIVGWAVRPEIGVAGLQLIGPEGEIQHAGVILGMGGFADHVFEGMAPGSQSHLGPTGWYRNTLAVTGACLAVRREVFEQLGGFDERFVLCGSDVAIGLDAVLLGYRNVCSPYSGLRHLESATRGTDVPAPDFFASYWRYNPWLFGGDPYFSPNLSLDSRTPRLRARGERSPGDRLQGPLGRQFTVFRQQSSEAESRFYSDLCRATPEDQAAVEALHAANAAPFEVKTVNWFIPDIDSPFYGGINTAFRIADELAREHGVENRFIVWGRGPELFIRSALAAAFPALADAPIHFYDGANGPSLQAVPECDVAIATLWVTAFGVTHFQHAKRKFYLVQDFEPMFYPASTLYALTEETYRLGLYGLCNTDNLRDIYATEYEGKGWSFTPAIQPDVFHAEGRVERAPDEPVTVFVYARPGHWRNCWEMASLALEELKDRLGDRVRIVTAGSWAVPESGYSGMHHYGLLDYRATGELYRSCDVGLALTVSKHPSYLPLELMACGVPVVAFDNPWGHWVLQDGENSLLAKRTVDGLVECLERMVVDRELRLRLSKGGLATIAANHAAWGPALEGIYGYLCDPEGHIGS